MSKHASAPSDRVISNREDSLGRLSPDDSPLEHSHDRFQLGFFTPDPFKPIMEALRANFALMTVAISGSNSVTERQR